MPAGGVDAALPGQTMDLDAVSGDEKGDEVQEVPVTGKRKSEAGASPTKREAQGGDTFSWQALRGMLTDQTREMQAWYRDEMGGAIQKSELKIMEAVGAIKADLVEKIDAGGDKLQKMEKAYADLKTCMDKLETGGGSVAPGSRGNPDRGPSLVFGGWRTDTKKTHILSDLTAVLKDSQVECLLDSAAWVPAVRHSVAIAEFAQRKDENLDGMRARMMAVIAAVNGAKIQSEHTAPEKTIWAAISRPRSERGPGTHCGKIRKLFYQLGIGVAEVECGYSTGSTWFKDKLVSSVEKVRNGPQVVKGVLENSWVDIPLIADLSGKKAADIQEAWSKITQS